MSFKAQQVRRVHELFAQWQSEATDGDLPSFEWCADQLGWSEDPSTHPLEGECVLQLRLPNSPWCCAFALPLDLVERAMIHNPVITVNLLHAAGNQQLDYHFLDLLEYVIRDRWAMTEEAELRDFDDNMREVLGNLFSRLPSLDETQKASVPWESHTLGFLCDENGDVTVDPDSDEDETSWRYVIGEEPAEESLTNSASHSSSLSSSSSHRPTTSSSPPSSSSSLDPMT